MASLAIPTIVTKAFPSLNSTVFWPFEFAYTPSSLLVPHAETVKLPHKKRTRKQVRTSELEVLILAPI
jgi:hypothetical protein